jgi:hypothetical protein
VKSNFWQEQANTERRKSSSSSLHSPPYMSIATSKANSPKRAIWCFVFQFTASI